MNPCYGLTGGIGSGKSTIAQYFADLGVRIVDTDLISHQLTQANGLAIPQIALAFGRDFLDTNGSLNRTKMREQIFSHPKSKQQLETILHPLILAHTQSQVTQATSAPYTLVVVPLLFESPHYRNWLTQVIVADCPEELQISRTMQRSGLSESAVRAIMSQQMPRTQRLQHANFVIHNALDQASLQPQVVALHNRLILR